MLANLVVAFGATAILISLLRRVALRTGLVDRPSSRKTHVGEIPIVGGVALGIAFFAAVLASDPLMRAPAALPFAAAGLVVLVTGFLDDLQEISSSSKFVGQIVAAVLMSSWAGVYLADLGNLWGTGGVVLGNWAIPFTVFCVVGVVNAMNMIDGLDGLAGGIGLAAAAWFCGAAAVLGTLWSSAVLGSFIAALAGFLAFNLRHPLRRRAAVFLGDAGSMLIGFVLAWFAVDLARAPHGEFYPIAAVWILGLPIMDTVYVMLRRALRGGSPFGAARDHVHHSLVQVGLSEGTASAILIALSTLCGAVGFFGWYFAVPEYLLNGAFLASFAVYCGLRHYRLRVGAPQPPALDPGVRTS